MVIMGTSGTLVLAQRIPITIIIKKVAFLSFR
ncbi:hypothetical protein RCH18_003236 [Flavobacterium sp. PL11]|nr:hypothetical protein [Flavobacterium sp. PL11]